MSEEVIWGLAGMAFVVLIVAILFIPIAKIAQTKIQTTKEEVYHVFCNRKVQRNAIKNAEVCHPFNSFSTMRGTVYSSRHEKR